MEFIPDKLIDVFENQSHLHRLLISALTEEKQAILSSDLSALNKANGEKEIIISKIRDLEDKRVRMLKDLAKSFGIKSHGLTIEKLTQLIEKSDALRLKRCRNNLLSLIQNAMELNEGNKILLTNSIELVAGSLRLLNNLMNCNAVYHRTGKIQNKNHGGRVLYGEI